MGIPYTTLMDYTKGIKKDPKISFIQKIMDYSKEISLSWLITGEGQMMSEEKSLRELLDASRRYLEELEESTGERKELIKMQFDMIKLKDTEIDKLKREIEVLKKDQA